MARRRTSISATSTERPPNDYDWWPPSLLSPAVLPLQFLRPLILAFARYHLRDCEFGHWPTPEHPSNSLDHRLPLRISCLNSCSCLRRLRPSECTPAVNLFLSRRSLPIHTVKLYQRACWANHSQARAFKLEPRGTGGTNNGSTSGPAVSLGPPSPPPGDSMKDTRTWGTCTSRTNANDEPVPPCAGIHLQANFAVRALLRGTHVPAAQPCLPLDTTSCDVSAYQHSVPGHLFELSSGCATAPPHDDK